MTRTQENTMVYLTAMYKAEFVREYINDQYYEQAKDLCAVVYELYLRGGMSTNVALRYLDYIVSMYEGGIINENLEEHMRKGYGGEL